MATLEQLIIFFLLIGVGVIARKVGVITPGNTPQLTSLVFNFAMPAIILSGITTEQPHISGKDLSIVLTSAFTTLILLIICSRMLARILRYEREYYGVITVMFSHDKEALNQYFRQMTPNTGPFDVNVISDAMSAVVDKSGPAILFTHSQGGGPGWYTAMKNNKVKAIVAFEPGSGFVFPEKELPAPMPSAFDTLKGEPVPMEQFMALTKIPILIIYGDNIPDKPVAMPAQDSWRVRLAMARKWRDVVNKHGGDVTVTHLPEVGIKGNTHFPFTDLNNVQIADLVSRFLKEKNLQ